MNIRIEKVESRKQLKLFVTFPLRLYKDCENWVPALEGDEYDTFNPEKNGAYDFCEADCFLAYRGDEIVGRVAAGEPIFAEQNIEDTFPLPDRFVNGGNNFMLRVKGESMIEAGIMDGDLILVQETHEARNGEIVVALIDGIETGATVKTFYRRNGKIYLTPENKTMGPIIVDDATIVGKVKGVFRYFN